MKTAQRITIKFVTLVLILLFLMTIGRLFKIGPEELKAHLHRFSIIKAGLIFILLYVTVTFFIWLSKDAFRLAAAILFGANLSSLFVWIAETLNAVILFHFSRYMGREFVEKKFLKDKSPKWEERLTRHSGFFSLLLFRMIPLIPFRFLDLFMGLTPIPFNKYILVVTLGSPLRIYWLQFILAAVGANIFKDPAVLMQYLVSNRAVFIASIVYLILAIILGFKLGGKRQ